MPTNLVFDLAQLSLACTAPAAPNSGDPVRYGFQTGVALTDEDAVTGLTTVDMGMKVWDLSVQDEVGGGIAAGATLFYKDGATPPITNDPSATYFFGFALEAVGVGLTATINVLHVPSPGSGTLGAGTIATANLAAGILSADAAGRALLAAGYFDVATALSAFAANSIANAFLLDAVADGAFVADAATRALFADGIWTEAKLSAASLTGLVAAVVADANVIGGLPVVHRVDVADAASGDVDTVLTHKTRVLDVWLIKTGALGGAANTIQVFNGAAGAITDAISINIADQAVARAATIDDAQHEIAAGGTLKITRTKAGGNAGCTVYVLGCRVA